MSKKLRAAWRFLFLCALLLPVQTAEALTWRWSQTPGRERVTIQLDAPNPQATMQRTGLQSLSMNLGTQPQAVRGEAAPGRNALVAGVEATGSGIRVNMGNPAFGFVSTRPNPSTIVLDVFSDPVGARWRGTDTTPAAVAATTPAAPPAQTAQPVQPNAPAQATQPQGTQQQPTRPAQAAQTTAPAVVQTINPAATAAAPAPSNSPAQAAQPATLATTQPTALAAQTPATPATPARNGTVPPAGNAAQPQNQVPNQPQTQSPALAQGQLQQETISPPPGTQPSAFVVPPSATAATPSIARTAQAAQPPQPMAQQTTPPQPTQTPPQPTQTPPPAASAPEVRFTFNSGGPAQWTQVNPGAAASAATPATPGTPATPAVQNPSAQTGVSSAAASAVSVQPAAPAIPAAPAASATQAVQTAPQTQGTAQVAGSLQNQPPVTPAAQTPAQTTPQRQATVATPESSGTPAQPQGQEQEEKPADENRTETAGQNAEKTATPAGPVVYQDEKGNIVPPPLDIPDLTQKMRKSISTGVYTDLLPILETLKAARLDPPLREEVLYNYMTTLYESNKPKFEGEVYDKMMSVANEAMNFNLKSPRVPEALSVLGMVNLYADNPVEAGGYIRLLRTNYPADTRVTGAMLLLGKMYLDKGEYALATDVFNDILQNYPQSQTAKDAARLEAMALYKQGHLERALTILDFVDRRWPRVYLEDPDYLLMAADVQYQQGRLEDALEKYWTQFNLLPDAPTRPATMMRIAEIYSRLNKSEQSSKVLEELLTLYPKDVLAPEALLHLGENHFYPSHLSVDEILHIFNLPNPRMPEVYYNRILKEYPNSDITLPVKLRQAVWLLWGRDYKAAMEAAQKLMAESGGKPEFLQAKDVLLRAFSFDLALALSEENYDKALTLWQKYPEVRDYYNPMPDDLRVALARGYLNRGDEKQGLELLQPFIQGRENPQYGLYAFSLFLNSYIRQEDWNGIMQLGEAVAAWQLPQAERDRLDYSMALAAQNSGLTARALPLWQKLAPNQNLPLYQRAYATYFLARDAEKKQDLRAAYQYNLDALAMFTRLAEENSPYANKERERESVAALMDVTEMAGRIAESLDWANRYAAYVPEKSPDYAGLRFREARLHRKMGDLARWKAILDGIVASEPDSVFGKAAASELRTQEVARDLARFAPE